ncbi:hypothetical protein Tco_0392485 [Tanacetum coccineum]
MEVYLSMVKGYGGLGGVQLIWGDKEVTMQYLVLKGSDRGACKPLGDVMVMLERYKWICVFYTYHAYTTVEEQRMKWTSNNQDTLRVDLYHNLCDAVTRGNTNAAGLVVYVIEFQKRGLPHAHILLWLEEHSKYKTPSEIDDIISAELPSPIDNPAGYKLATEYMLHGPCRKDARYAACTNDGKCSKHFPKPFLAETFLDEEGYPHYRRRDNKVTIKKEIPHTITSM